MPCHAMPSPGAGEGVRVLGVVLKAWSSCGQADTRCTWAQAAGEGGDGRATPQRPAERALRSRDRGVTARRPRSRHLVPSPTTSTPCCTTLHRVMPCRNAPCHAPGSNPTPVSAGPQRLPKQSAGAPKINGAVRPTRPHQKAVVCHSPAVPCLSKGPHGHTAGETWPSDIRRGLPWGPKKEVGLTLSK